MIPEPRYVMTTAMAIPAITAPAPRPSRTKRMMSFMTYSALAADVLVAMRRSDANGYGYPSFGRPDEVAGLLPLAVAVVLVELRVVVAHAGRIGVLAALEHGRAEDQRTLEGLHLLDDRVGREVVGADRVQELGQRHRLPEADQHPRITDLRLVALRGEDVGVRRHRRVGGIDAQRRGDGVDPLRQVAELLRRRPALMQIGLASTFSSGMPSCWIACWNLTQSLGLMTGITRSTSWAPAAISGTVRSGVSAGYDTTSIGMPAASNADACPSAPSSWPAPSG